MRTEQLLCAALRALRELRVELWAYAAETCLVKCLHCALARRLRTEAVKFRHRLGPDDAANPSAPPIALKIQDDLELFGPKAQGQGYESTQVLPSFRNSLMQMNSVKNADCVCERSSFR
jgi:hypothetical protein